jgi:poly(hydroxyalkanoate) depolymerase family esterase
MTMRKKWMIAFMIVLILGVMAGALAIRADRNLERGVLKSEISSDGMAYDFYIPEQASWFRPLPLVVVFHGGLINLEEMEELTTLQELADRFGFYVLYPLQDATQNADGYWNWFLPENQQRGIGEPSRIVELLSQLPQPYRIDSTKTVALGFSAGGAMALSMQILYPDVFSGVAIAAGVPFASASNLYEAAMAMAGFLPTEEQLAVRAIEALPYAKGKPIRAIVVHGLADTRVRPEASFAILRQLCAVNDMLDDGLINGSFAAIPVYDGPWMDDPLGLNRFVRYRNANRDAILLGYFIEGMAHRYPHPTSTSPYASGEGMNFSLSAIEFLLEGLW